MNYTVFSAHTKGESHKKEGMDCEDYSEHYSDPEGRFAIGVICDGHSDAKCFRSAVGAKLGCDSLIQVMRAWMESFLGEKYSDPMAEIQAKKEEILQRIRMAFVQTWNYKVLEHIRNHPITKEELSKLDTPANRTAMRLYSEGKYLQHIYGATMLAVVGCDDFHIAMQIGDGVIIKVEKGGFYSIPVEDDDKDAAAEGPESMCDSDLLSRKKAFRISVNPGCPQALFVTSDGIGDMAYTWMLWESICTFQTGLMQKQNNNELQQGLMELNEAQNAFLMNFVDYYAVHGTNADDCCFSGFYDPHIPVSQVRLSEEELQNLYKSMEEEYQLREEKYRKSQALLQENLQKVQFQIDSLESEINNLKKRGAELESKLNAAKDESNYYQEMLENNKQNSENDKKQLQYNQAYLKAHYETGTTIPIKDGDDDTQPKKQPEENVPVNMPVTETINKSDTILVARVPKQTTESAPGPIDQAKETITETAIQASAEATNFGTAKLESSETIDPGNTQTSETENASTCESVSTQTTELENTPTTESVNIPTPEPVSVQTPESVSASTTEPASIPTPESVNVPTPEPASVSTPESVSVQTPESVNVPTAEPVSVPVPESENTPISESENIKISD